MNIRQKERFFFFTHAIIILSLFTYSVLDEKVQNDAGVSCHKFHGVSCHKLCVRVCVCGGGGGGGGVTTP